MGKRQWQTSVFVDLKYSDAWRVIVNRLRRKTTLYMRWDRNSIVLRVLKRLKWITQMNLDDLDSFAYRDSGDRWPAREFLKSRLSQDLAQVVISEAERLQIGELDPRLALAVVSKVADKRHYETSILDCWLRAEPKENFFVVADEPAMADTLRHSPNVSNLEMRYRWKFTCVDVVTGTLVWLRLGALARLWLSRIGGQNVLQRGGSGELLQILNKSSGYGRLYNYSYIYSDEGSSPLHMSRIKHLYLARNPNVPLRDGDHDLQAMYGSRLKRFLIATALYASYRQTFGSRNARLGLWQVTSLVAQAIDLAVGGKRIFPEVSVAYLTFEYQVTPSLSLAFALSGIKTIAANERPNMCYHEGAAILCDRLLVGDEEYGQAILMNPSSFVEEAEPTGLWRTDFFFSDEASASVDMSGEVLENRPEVVVLPFVIMPETDTEIHDPTVQASGFDHFMKEVMIAAERFPSARFIIRGKNLEWTTTSTGAPLFAALSAAPNIRVDENYEVEGRTYKLCQSATVILAKYTSVVDECILAGIPTLIHDYTRNSSGRFLRTNSYIPRNRFCLSRNEMLAALEDKLILNPGDFKRRTESSRLCDGMVRQRIRVDVEAYLQRFRPR